MLNPANPRQTVLVSTRAKTDVLGKETEKDNILAVDWHCPINFDPELYGISIGKQRFSHELIKKSKTFAVNFMPYSQKDSVLFCGRHTGKTIDKFKKSSLTKEEAELIDCPIVGECVAYLECEVVNAIDFQDHTFFIGRVLKKQIKSESNRVFHKGDNEFTTTV